MERVKRWALELVLAATLLLALLAWVALPWTGALAGLGVLALWLGLTRSGRLTFAATRIGLGSLRHRLGAALVVVVGIAGVVGVLVAMLAMADGFTRTLGETGSDRTAIIIRAGSQSETNSTIDREQAALISTLAGIAHDADGQPLLSAETTQVVTLTNAADGNDANAQVRGIDGAGWTLRPQAHIVSGRTFEPGRQELVVGARAADQYTGLEVGSQITLANQRWDVVGIFSTGDAHDSELWTDSETLAASYRRHGYQSITVALDGNDGLERLQAAIGDDPRLKLDVATTAEFYSRQSRRLAKIIQVLGTVIGTIMACGAVFGALNTMYAAVAVRTREIGTLRALGFAGVPVVLALMLETLLLALTGGLLGAGVAYLLFNGHSVSTLGANFSQIMFQFRVSPELLWHGIKWAVGIGLLGGLYPALRAARLPLTSALRAA